MKRIYAFILCIAIIIPFFVSSVYADDTSGLDVLENAVYYTCDYDAKNKQVMIEGTVNHDFMLSHGDYSIKVVSFLPGESLNNISQKLAEDVLAEAEMSVKFTFHIKTESNIERYSKYAILFCSSSGESFIAGEPKIPSVSSDFSYDPSSRTGFKGFISQSPAQISDSGAGTVLIDVDLGKMLGDISDSILYPMNNSYIHIRKSYITEIDKKVAAACVGNGRVYFRLLLRSTDTSLEALDYDDTKKYSIPNVYSESVIDYVLALTSFIVERYSAEDGVVKGIVAGSCIDDIHNVNAVGDIDVEEYADIYTLYLTVLANAVRDKDNTVDIVIPLSDANDYTSDAYFDEKIRASVLLDEVIDRLDNTVSGEFHCSVMIESGITPLGITCTGIGNGININFKGDATRIGVDNISDFTAYLDALAEKYDNVPSNVSYLWYAEPSLSGDALCCAYTYSYQKLAKISAVSSFIADLGDNFDSALRVFKYIDTDNSNEAVAPFLRYFNDVSWSKGTVPVRRVLIEKNFLSEAPSGMRGEFQYMDFTASSVYECMIAGENCNYIRSDYDSVGTRALRVGAEELSLGETVECIGFFEYEEDYSYTEYLSLRLEVQDSGASESALYEISLTVGMDTARTVAVGVVQNGGVNELFFDASDFSEISGGDYIKISVRCLTDDSKEMSVWLHELKGYSSTYTSEELDDLIEERRREIRGENDDGDDGVNYAVIMTVVGILFALGAVAIGLLMVFRRESDEDKNKE